MIYYYGPMSILLLLNIRYFVLTAWSCYIQSKDCNILLNPAQQPQRKLLPAEWVISKCFLWYNNLFLWYFSFMMFLRFFTIYVLVWFIEIISYLMHRIEPNWIDYIPSSQGIFIFIVTILRKDLLKSIYDRWLHLRIMNFLLLIN